MRKQKQSDGGESFADFIKAARERDGLTRQEAAEKWGVPRGTIRNWEQGIATPKGLALAAIKKFLQGTIALAALLEILEG